MEVLATNSHLLSLNLSWNLLIDKLDQNNPVKFKVRSAMDDYIEERKKAIEQNMNEEEEVYDHPEFVIKCLNSLIRYNKKI